MLSSPNAGVYLSRLFVNIGVLISKNDVIREILGASSLLFIKIVILALLPIDIHFEIVRRLDISKQQKISKEGPEEKWKSVLLLDLPEC